jgi:hypothetical protein
MNNKLDEFYEKIKLSLLNVQQNVELLSVYLVNSKKSRPLLSMMSMEEVRMFASFEETIRCIDNTNKYCELRLTSTRDQKLAFRFIDGPCLLTIQDSTKQYVQFAEDMSSCIYREQLIELDGQPVDFGGHMLVWKNLQTGEVIRIKETLGYITNLVFDKINKICIGEKFFANRHEDRVRRHFVVYLHSFPTYCFEAVESAESLGVNDILKQFIDNGKTMLVSTNNIGSKYFLRSTLALSNKEEHYLIKQPIRLPKDSFQTCVVGNPHGSLLAWHAKYWIGIYDTVTDETTTLKQYDQHDPMMFIGYFQDVNFAFSKRYVAFGFQLRTTRDEYDSNTKMDCTVIIVYDTVEKILYETKFEELIDVACCRFLNDHDCLIISTRRNGMKMWDFKSTKEITDLQIACVDTFTNMVTGKLDFLSLFRCDLQTVRPYIASFEVAYLAPF